MSDWKIAAKLRVLPPLGFLPKPSLQEEMPISAIVDSEEFEHSDWEQKQLALGETILDKFWISPGPWRVAAMATVYNKADVWTDPVLVLQAKAADSSYEATANGGAGLHQTWKGGCEIHTQSEAITLVTCSIHCLVGTGLISDVKVWAYRPQ
ncbi:MAG TPA: hypothetical protein VN577_21145 [Terriglobales bacterium]|nr:hypothetical protein [Terriglobales bacterium]